MKCVLLVYLLKLLFILILKQFYNILNILYPSSTIKTHTILMIFLIYKHKNAALTCAITTNLAFYNTIRLKLSLTAIANSLAVDAFKIMY